MKARKAKDLRDLSDVELRRLLGELQETKMNQGFQHQLGELTDSAYICILRRDIARVKTVLRERNIAL
jgi:large subunit ribosomal protein L29